MQQRTSLNLGVSVTRQQGVRPEDATPEQPGRYRRFVGALLHAGVLEDFEDTVVFQDSFAVSGGPLAANRYRR